MHSPLASQLSIMVTEEQSSRLYPSPWVKQHLQSLRLQLLGLLSDFQLFKESTLSGMKEWMGRTSSLLYRSLKERSFLEVQLDKSKQIQNTMRAQVIQLKEMINQAMNDYAKDLQTKQRQIRLLNDQLSKKGQKVKQSEQRTEEIRIQEEGRSEKEESLEVIQEESEQATFSSVTSLMEFRQEESKSSEDSTSKQQISIVPESHFKSIDPQGRSQPQPLLHSSPEMGKSDHKKTKSFIDNFRKTIEQSFHDQSQPESVSHQKSIPYIPRLKLSTEDKQNLQAFKPKKLKSSQQETQNSNVQPLKDIGNFQQPIFFTNYLKEPEKKNHIAQNIPKTFYLHAQCPVISNSSSESQLGNLSEVQQENQINAVKYMETPNCTFIKKKPMQFHQRFKTEPDHPASTSNYFTHKPSNSYSKGDRKPNCQRSFSDSKSAKTAGSKEKIKVTSRMMEEINYQPKKNHNAPAAKALVHLGGKSQFRKFLIQLKNAFRKYNVDVGSALEEFKYEGELRNKQRWGRGRLLYRNGLVYEGEFQDNKRHGRGSLFLNGISIYEGEWVSDKFGGEGYIKSMKYTGVNCPGLFKQASYCGNLSEGRFHGIGTIFLNPKEKIVTKFSGGGPVGELTYYNLHEIEFGVWPVE